MTEERKKELVLASRVPITLYEYVEDLLEEQYQLGFNSGWDEGVSYGREEMAWKSI